MSETDRWAWGLAFGVFVSLLTAYLALQAKWANDRESERNRRQEESDRARIADTIELKDALQSMGIMLAERFVTKDDLKRETRAQTAEILLRVRDVMSGQQWHAASPPRPLTREEPESEPPPSRSRLPSRPR